MTIKQANEWQVKIGSVLKSLVNVKARLDIETCFAAGTLVHTKDGLRPIEELKVGDLVLTWPQDMPIPRRPRLPDEYIYKPVTKTFVREDTVISHVPLLVTGVGDDEDLRVTPNHPVYAERHGWLPISALKPSYRLVWASFSNALVRRMKHDVERVTVYNIEVEDCHTYFVGKMGLWVHNKRASVTEIGFIRDVHDFNSSVAPLSDVCVVLLWPAQWVLCTQSPYSPT